MHETKIIRCPNHIKPFRQSINRDEISIDIEIIDVIEKLWEKNIITLHSCQGDKNNPEIVIAEGYVTPDIIEIKKIISNIDKKRKWKIYKWEPTLKEV